MRDLRVRWALEEVGLPYEVTLIGPEDQRSAAYRALQPFGQVLVYEEGGISLFESGAIVQHIGERSDVLLPKDPQGRARRLDRVDRREHPRDRASHTDIVQETPHLEAYRLRCEARPAFAKDPRRSSSQDAGFGAFSSNTFICAATRRPARHPGGG